VAKKMTIKLFIGHHTYTQVYEHLIQDTVSIRRLILILFSLIAVQSDPLLAEDQSEVAVAKLRSLGANVEWVTEWGYIAGHEMPLPEEEQYYRISIGKEWAGGNEGLKWIGKVKRLKRLIFFFSPSVDDGGFEKIGRLPDVEELTVSGLAVSDNGLGFLNSIPNLKVLHLTSLSISDDALTGLDRIKSLEEVSFYNLRRIEDGAITATKDLPRLQKLILWKTPVTDAGLKHLNPRLERLNLRETAIGDEGVRSLPPLNKLQHLDLTWTKVSDRGLMSLTSLPALKTLFVAGTDVTPYGARQFLKALDKDREIEVSH